MESISPTNQPTRPPVWQLVVRKPFDAPGVSEFAFWLSNNTVGFLVGEHPADEQVNSTHCHILIEGLKVTTEGFRKSLIRCDISGSDYSLMKKRKKGELDNERGDYSRDLLAPYVLKGELSYLKSTLYNSDLINKWVSQWVKHKPKHSIAIGERVAVKKPKTDYEKCQEILDVELSHLKNTEENPNVYNIKQGKFHETAQSRTEIIKGIICWGNRTGHALHPRKVMDYYGIVLQNACPEYYTTLIVDMINNQYRHSYK